MSKFLLSFVAEKKNTLKYLWEDSKAAHKAAGEATFGYRYLPVPGLFTVFTIGMFIVLIAGIFGVYSYVQMGMYGIKITGTITSYHDYGCNKEQEDIHETILFFTADEIPVVFDNQVENLPCDMTKHDTDVAVGIGKTIQVLYNPDEPQNAETYDKYQQQPFLMLIMITFGLGMCVIYTITKIRFVRYFRQIRYDRRHPKPVKQPRTIRKVVARTGRASRSVRYARKRRRQ